MNRKVYGAAAQRWCLRLLAVAAIGLPLIISGSFAVASSTWGQVGDDIASTAASDQSGRAVSMNTNGTRVAVGSPYHDGSKGTVRVYEWNSGSSSWVQVGADIDGEAAGDQSGISVSISGDGNRVAIGAPLNDGTTGTASDDRGHVRIYDWNGSAWVRAGADIDGEATLDNSGSSVSLSSDGTRVAIGAHKNDGGGADTGHVRVFQWDSGTSQWNKVDNDIDGAAGDWFGYSVSLSSNGGWLAIGAPKHNSSEGAVRIYQATGSSWTKIGGDIDGEAGGDESGQSVSLSSDGTRVAIGAHKNDSNGADAGHVRIYDWDAVSSSWTQAGTDIDGEAAGDQAGVSVSLSSDGTRVAIGAYLHDGNDGNDEDSGQVRIYDWNGSAWSQVGYSLGGEADTDYSGYSVSLAGDKARVAIGAILSDDGAPDAGHVRVYEENATPSLSACSPATTSYTSGSTVYTVVAFKSVGTCSWAIPSGVTMFDWLVVGGGGGGGSWHGAGGGAGGMRSNEGLNVPLDTSFTIQAGAGGAGAPELTSGSPTAVRGSSGGASRIIGSSSGVLANVLGGGGGGSGTNIGTDGNDGAAGGSGGGAQAALTYGGTIGVGTSGEGNRGGTGAGGGISHPGTAWVAGGGGGAGSEGGGAGESLGDVRAGNGGAGAANSWLTTSAATALGVGEVSGSDVYFAGGGAGAGDETVTYTLGTGGLGGGGDGRLYAVGAGEDGAASTGGGGAGSSLTAGGATRVGGAGGSGVVVLRYAQAAPTTTTTPPATTAPPAPAPAATTTSTTTTTTTTTTAPTTTSTTTVPLPTETPPNPANLPVGQMTSNTTVSAGTSMAVAAVGFAPNELVAIFTVTDTDIDTIAATTATNEGTVTAEITMPSDACGEVILIAWAPGSGVGIHQTVNVTQCAASEEISADRLPVTGDENNLAMWALLFAALGGLATLRVRTPR